MTPCECPSTAELLAQHPEGNPPHCPVHTTEQPIADDQAALNGPGIVAALTRALGPSAPTNTEKDTNDA